MLEEAIGSIVGGNPFGMTMQVDFVSWLFFGSWSFEEDPGCKSGDGGGQDGCSGIDGAFGGGCLSVVVASGVIVGGGGAGNSGSAVMSGGGVCADGGGVS